MNYPVLARLHQVARYKDESAFLPGTDRVIELKEAAIFSIGDRPFFAMEDLKGRVWLCCLDSRFQHLLIPGDDLLEALTKWYENFDRTGDGL